MSGIGTALKGRQAEGLLMISWASARIIFRCAASYRFLMKVDINQLSFICAQINKRISLRLRAFHKKTGTGKLARTFGRERNPLLLARRKIIALIRPVMAGAAGFSKKSRAPGRLPGF